MMLVTVRLLYHTHSIAVRAHRVDDAGYRPVTSPQKRPFGIGVRCAAVLILPLLTDQV